MRRRWLKIRKTLVRRLLPLLRWMSPTAASRIVAGIGRVEHALVPLWRLHHDEPVRRWSAHFDSGWDVRCPWP